MLKNNTKTYIAPTFNMALKKVKLELGADAMIVSHDTVNGQAHVVAIVESVSTNEQSKQEFGKSLFERSLIPNDSNEIQHVDEVFSSVLMSTASQKKQTTNKRKVSATHKLSEDIEYIKSILQNNVLKISTIDESENDSYLRKLRRKLRQKGFGRQVVDQILYGAIECQSLDKLSKLMIENLIHLIRFNKMDFCSQRRVKAFIGPSGGGKTSLMTKLMIHLRENKIDSSIALIFVNHSNIKVMEESKILGRIFNIPSYYVENAKELEAAYHKSHDKNSIFIELPALDYQNSANNFFFEFLYKFANDIDNTLVLPTIVNAMATKKFLGAYGNIAFDGIALTKWDESQHCEAVLNTAINHQIPLRFISEGADNLTPLLLANKEYFASYLQNTFFFQKSKQSNDLVSLELNEVKINDANDAEC